MHRHSPVPGDRSSLICRRRILFKRRYPTPVLNTLETPPWTMAWSGAATTTQFAARTSLVLALGAAALFTCHFPVRAVAARIGRPGRNSGHEA